VVRDCSLNASTLKREGSSRRRSPSWAGRQPDRPRETHLQVLGRPLKAELEPKINRRLLFGLRLFSGEPDEGIWRPARFPWSTAVGYAPAYARSHYDDRLLRRIPAKILKAVRVVWNTEQVSFSDLAQAVLGMATTHRAMPRAMNNRQPVTGSAIVTRNANQLNSPIQRPPTT